MFIVFMKNIYKIFCVSIFALLFFLYQASYAASGIFDRSIILELNTVNYYNGPLFDTTFFGVFSSNDILNFKGGQLKTYKNGQDDITGAAMYIRVYKSGAITLPEFDTLYLPWKEDVQSPYGSIDQTWENAGQNNNILSNLSNGDYLIEVYFEAFYTDQTGSHIHVDNNSGNNYTASFSINNCVIELGGDITYCTAFNHTIVAQPGHYSYVWNTGDTTASIQVTQAGAYIVTITDNGCTAVDSMRIDTSGSTFTLNIGNDTIICGIGLVTLNAGSAFDSYLWSTGDTLMQLAVNTGGVYIVTVTDPNNCLLVDTCTVNFSPLPDVDIGTSYMICTGDSVVLDAGGGYAAYAWSSGAISQSISALTPGVYGVTVTSNMGCQGFDIVNVSVENHPVSDFNYTMGTGLAVLFTDNSSYSTKNFWDFVGNGNYIEYAPGNVSYTYPFAGTYTVRQASVNNCDSDTSEMIVNVIAGIAAIADVSAIEIYPNPAGKFLFVRWSPAFDVSVIDITNMAGKSVYSVSKADSGKLGIRQIDVSGMPPGVYSLKILIKKDVIIKKFVKL